MIKRELNRPEHPDDVFRLVLGVLWKYAVQPVIRQLGLKVGLYQQFYSLELTLLCRNLQYSETCGGALQDNWPFFPYTQRGYMMLRSPSMSLNMCVRLTHRPLLRFFAICLCFPLNPRWL